MKSSVLIIGHPEPQRVHFGADFVNDFAGVQDFNYPVIVFSVDSLNSSLPFLKKINRLAPRSQKIFVSRHFAAEVLQKLTRESAEHIFLTDYDSDQFDIVVQKALTRHQELLQKDVLNHITKDQNTSLKNLSAELSELVDKREKNLQRSQKRFLNVTTQVEALQKALMAVHTSQSISEIESFLFSALADTLNLSWVRIFLFSNDHLENQLSRIQGQKLFKAVLNIDSRSLGKLVMARQDNKEFTKSEEESLLQITESVALALDRIAKLEQAETLKFQWESTFDAISEPLCLTDEKFNILKTNKAFLQTTKLKPSSALGVNCFSAFCGPNAPAQVTPSPSALVLQRTQKSNKEPHYYEVTTQRIRVQTGTPSILIILFRDVTEQKKIEKQIFESSKMAELGTIGSSIAHDINNPLGGMLSFIQLIKMDLKPEHPFYDDIVEMESAGHRCKEIVENLLRFSRRQETGAAEVVDLKEVLNHAIKIMTLQTRSLGIQIDFVAPDQKTEVLGHFNLLSQALNHVMQNAVDAVSEKLVHSPRYKGQIKVELAKSNDAVTVTIFDNGVGIIPENQNKILNPLFTTKSKKHGLGLTLAFQIVTDHDGQLEIFSQPNVGTTVKISLINV